MSPASARPTWICTGGAGAPLILRDSNPGHLFASPGGVTRNILENLSRMGAKQCFFPPSARTFRTEILASAESAGIDVSMCAAARVDQLRVSALLDRTGDVVAMSDMRIFAKYHSRVALGERGAAPASQAVVAIPACRRKHWMITSGALGDTALFVDPVSTAYARRLAPTPGAFSASSPM